MQAERLGDAGTQTRHRNALLRAIGAESRQVRRQVVGEALAKATFPVLLVWGSEDKTVAPEVGRQVKTLVPRSDLVELEGAAHTAYYERADTFNTIVTGYLEQPRQRHSVDGVRWN